MVKNKKGRCVKKNNQVDNEEPQELLRAPHSFVIHRGLPCPNIIDLTRDFRRIMEPFTASNLRERKSNKIKDFISLSSTFHVSHMCIFNRSTEQLSMKLTRLPRGPTLTFKIHQFTLTKDVISSQRKPYIDDKAYEVAPLVILNSFSGEGKQLKLMATTFQNMFPTINVATVKLSKIRRCVLFSYNPTTKLIDMRHFAVRVVPVGVSKGVKKIITGKIPNLAKCDDISDYLEKSNCLSDSEFEDDETGHVVVPQNLQSRGNIENKKSAIKLYELGPRLTIQLMKVEEGLFNGEVLFHEFIVKTEEEKEKIRKKREQVRRLKESRKQEQIDNKRKKEEAKQDQKKQSLAGMKEEKDDETQELENDAEYYKEEVGQNPDNELFDGATQNRKRAFIPKGIKMKGIKKRKLDRNEVANMEKGKNKIAVKRTVKSGNKRSKPSNGNKSKNKTNLKFKGKDKRKSGGASRKKQR